MAASLVRSSSGWSMALWFIRVRIMPGATPFTAMPWGASSSARVAVSWASPPLCRIIIDAAGPRCAFVDGGNVDDASFGSRPVKTAHEPPACQKRAIEISTKDAIEHGEAHVCDTDARHIASGGIDEQRHGAKGLLRRGEQGFHLRFFGHVGLNRQRATARWLYGIDEGLGRCTVTKIGDRDSRARICDLNRGGRANARLSSGNDRCHSIQIHYRSKSVVPQFISRRSNAHRTQTVAGVTDVR